MKHSVQHTLGKDMARKVARAAFESYKQRFAEFNPRTDWINEDRAEIAFAVKGMALKGNVAVTDTSIDMDLDVPFLLKPFQGTAIKVIGDEIQGWIEKAKRGEIA